MSHQSLIQQVLDRNSKVFTAFPDKESADEFIAQLFHFLFLPKSGRQQQYTELEKEFESLKSYFSTLIYDVIHDGDQTQQITEQFFSKIPSIYSALLKDAEAIVRFDPAAQAVEEVLVAYPGFFAIAIYRLSHQLSLSGVKIIPRLFTEYAHSKTGIDIHPAARIGESFFIDHGTGIVIGETAVIGSNVKIYQGVTIGALHTTVKDLTAKRHPTIKDNVVIYAGATILGGETIIGHDTIVGGNVWLTESVPPFSKVYHKSEIASREVDEPIDHFV